MRRISFITFSVLLAVSVSGAVLLPRDGDRITVQKVEFIAPTGGDGAVWGYETESHLCPPEGQPYEYALHKSLTAPEAQESPAPGCRQDGSPVPDAGQVAVTVTGDVAEAAFTAMADGVAEMILADILGRVYASAPRRAVTRGEKAVFTADIGGLPPGDYILHLLSGPDFQPVLIKIIKQ